MSIEMVYHIIIIIRTTDLMPVIFIIYNIQLLGIIFNSFLLELHFHIISLTNPKIGAKVDLISWNELCIHAKGMTNSWKASKLYPLCVKSNVNSSSNLINSEDDTWDNLEYVYQLLYLPLSQ